MDLDVSDLISGLVSELDKTFSELDKTLFVELVKTLFSELGETLFAEIGLKAFPKWKDSSLPLSGSTVSALSSVLGVTDSAGKGSFNKIMSSPALSSFKLDPSFIRSSLDELGFNLAFFEEFELPLLAYGTFFEAAESSFAFLNLLREATLWTRSILLFSLPPVNGGLSFPAFISL